MFYRFRPESSSFVQSPLTIPAPSRLTGTLSSIQRTSETSTTSAFQSDPTTHIPSGSPGLCFPSGPNPIYKNITPDSCSHKDNNVTDKRNPLQTGHNSQPLWRIQGNITQNDATKGETLPQKSKLQKNYLSNTSTSTKQTFYLQNSASVSHHAFAQASSSLTSCQESPCGPGTSICSRSTSETLEQMDPLLQAREITQSPNVTDSVLHKYRTQETGLTTNPHDSQLPLTFLDQGILSSLTSKETSSVSMPQNSNQTRTTSLNPTHIYCQASTPNNHGTVPEISNNLKSHQGIPFTQGNGGLAEVHAPVLLEPNSISNISVSNTTVTIRSKHSHQTVYSPHESLTSSNNQQCVHDPGMTPNSSAKPTAAPQPESPTNALAEQRNLHDTPLSSPSHLLTPDQDPNTCQPMAVLEEIRRTPQIKGPSLPAPPTLPQGKASKPGPPCFTRPLSRATVTKGSPVTLEVEVTGHPEPTLTWWVAYNQLHNNTQAL